MIDPDYFEKKRAELGLDRADKLTAVQQLLDQWYPGQTRARQLHQNVLRVDTPNASVAGELRMRQVELLSVLNLADTRLAINIRSLN